MSGIVKKVLRRDMAPMPSHYSVEIRELVKEMLDMDPSKRPDTELILASPVLINAVMDLETDVGRIPCLL